MASGRGASSPLPTESSQQHPNKELEQYRDGNEQLREQSPSPGGDIVHRLAVQQTSLSHPSYDRKGPCCVFVCTMLQPPAKQQQCEECDRQEEGPAQAGILNNSRMSSAPPQSVLPGGGLRRSEPARRPVQSAPLGAAGQPPHAPGGSCATPRPQLYWMDCGAADGAGRLVLEPGVDAASVEGVGAGGQQPASRRGQLGTMKSRRETDAAARTGVAANKRAHMAQSKSNQQTHQAAGHGQRQSKRRRMQGGGWPSSDSCMGHHAQQPQPTSLAALC